MLGHHVALMTGLPHTTGGLIFSSDSDLDEVPELMTQFHARVARVGVQET
jgi:putative glycosyltransferase